MNAKQKRRQSHMASVRERAATRKSRIKPQTERHNRVMLERRERARRPEGALVGGSRAKLTLGELDQIIKRQESGGFSKTRAK